MTITIFSVIMAIAFFTITSTICSLIITHTKSQHLWILAALIILSLLRCFLPIEVHGSMTINCWSIYPYITSIIEHKISGSLTIGRSLCLFSLLVSIGFLIVQVTEVSRQLHLIQKVKKFPADLRISELAKRAANALKYKKEVHVHITTLFPTPVMIGFFSPVILIPESIIQMEDQAIEYILRHEVSHYIKGDVWIKLFIQFFVCILWWNPAVYLLRRSINQLLELRSDHFACKSLTDFQKTEFASVLLKTLKGTAKHRKKMLTAGFIGHYYSSYLTQRIKMLSSPMPHRCSTKANLLTLFVCLLLYLGSYSFILQPATHPQELTDGSGYTLLTPDNAWLVPADNNQFEIWLNGEYYATISHESAKTPPFNQLPIH